ncbi:B-cell linker protein [Acipenser oxyrinchus oxyrinchus]|uniref:B-cell linker protein n=1 Tax=Acipenser oxyrinchus oxyrinchus TaxID=40147 RepID=A0AAD8D6U1_ACIOX|nr:B-cell linker protein [Acipenser oxyrinchus oxyrinchus]
MEKINKFTAPAGEKFRQLQKMVQDIKKNDGGLMNKFRKFQVANMRKTGISTWGRLTNKGPPSVPTRDYNPDDDNEEDQEWSDNEFDSDYENPDDNSETYEVPEHENDDSYEPPPCEQENRNIAPVLPISNGEYADNRTESKRPPPRKPFPFMPGHSASKPRLPSPQKKHPQQHQSKPKLRKEEADDCDYVCPKDDDDDEDDNYIDPTEQSASAASHPPPVVNRNAKPTRNHSPAPIRTDKVAEGPEVYEVPDLEEKPSPPINRSKMPLLPKTHQQPSPKGSSPTDSSRFVKPGFRKVPPPNPEPVDDDEYEICDPDNSISNDNLEDASAVTVLKTPIPRPREGKQNNPPLKPKPNLPSKDRPAAMKHSPLSVASEFAARIKPPLPGQNPGTTPPKVPAVTNRGSLPRTGPSSAEQDAGVYNKVWYASSSDRKTAEEALVRTNKDGSFLIRKSSGQDVKQPFTLVVFYKKKVYNIPVRYIESSRQYALGKEKTGEERFGSVSGIIENHQKTPLVLIDNQSNTKDSTKLKNPVKV